MADLRTEQVRLEQEQETLVKRIKQIGRALLAQIRGILVEDVDGYSVYRDREVAGAADY